jgi:Restriction endonuclease
VNYEDSALGLIACGIPSIPPFRSPRLLTKRYSRYNLAVLSIMAMIDNTAMMVITMSRPNQDAMRSKQAEFEALVANMFRRAGWNVVRQPSAQYQRLDLIADSGEKKYVVEVKQSSEGRRDRLIPLLSQAILQAQAFRKLLPEFAVPVGIIAADQIPGSVAEQLKAFAAQYAPEVAIGIVDLEGFREFQGFGLERFNSQRAVPSALSSVPKNGPPVHLFSNLNQWMLKVLLAPRIPESLLSAPRQDYQSAAQLGRAAGVSVMSASRLVRQLSQDGFIENRKGYLRLVRVEELMERWRGASHRNLRETGARWIIRGGDDQFRSAVQSYPSGLKPKDSRSKHSWRSSLRSSLPRVCVGLFAAAEALGMGFVRGLAPHLYLERLDYAALERLGLSLEDAGRTPDVQLRVPENEESIFRPVVWNAGVPVSDVIQIWLDVANHPARGKEQAAQIWSKVLAPAVRTDGREQV